MQHSSIRKPLGTAIMLVLAGGTHSATAGDSSSIAMDATGNSVVTWQDNSGADGDLSGIFARRYDVNGVPAPAAAFQVNTTAPGAQQSPAVAMAADGRMVVVWQSTDEGGDSGIYAQRYTADGLADGSEFRINDIATGVQQNPSVAMNAAGEFVVVWEDALANGNGLGIMARVYLADGSPLGSAVAINAKSSGDQLNPHVAIADNGTFTVSWLDAAGSVQLQRFDANAVAVGSANTVAAGFMGTTNRAALTAGIDVGVSMTSGTSSNTLTYNLRVTNYGDTAAGAVNLVDTLPANVGFISASGSGWTCSNNTPSAGKVSCDLASLASAGSSTVTIKVDTTGVSATSLTNSATVATSGDVNAANDTVSATVTSTASSGAAPAAGAFGWVTLLLGFFGIGLRRRWH